MSKIRFRWAPPLFHAAIDGLAMTLLFAESHHVHQGIGLEHTPSLRVVPVAYGQENQPGVSFDLSRCWDCRSVSQQTRFIALGTPPSALVASLVFPNDIYVLGEGASGLKRLALFETTALPFWWWVGSAADKPKSRRNWMIAFASVQLVALGLLLGYWQLGFVIQCLFWLAAGMRGFWIGMASATKKMMAKHT
jgi:hypothetical protein